MNIVKKLWVGTGGNGSSSSQESESNQSISLGLMHLRKLFGDHAHSPSDDKIYNMLPLFCKVFGSSATGEMIERFPEINNFAGAASKLLVMEVRRRANNDSAEAAAISIVKFFEAAQGADDDPGGWTLLSTLNLLSAGDQNLVDVMTAASVPSTLVKSLYLFFDLPQIQPPEMKGPGSDFSPMERRLLLQKVFVQLLIRLSSHASPAEELAKKDDLRLLFRAVTSLCPPHNAIWRKSAAEVLMTISTHGLTPPVLSYIHNKGCIGICVENLRKGGTQLTPLEVTEMVLTLFCFLKDSADLSQVLLDDFKSSQGYLFLTEILLRLEGESSGESQEAMRNLVLVIASLSMCGLTPLKPNMANVNSVFSLPTFVVPPVGNKGVTVRNLQAFSVLPLVFNRSTTPFLSSLVLESLFSVFKAEQSNYFIVDPALPQMAERLLYKTQDVSQKFLDIVEFIVFQLQFTPCKELIAISRILKNDLAECGSPTPEEVLDETRLKILCVKMLLSLAKHNSLFKDVYREVGILEVLVTCLHRFVTDIRSLDFSKDPNARVKDELGLSVIELLTLVLASNNSNVAIFRDNNGCKCTVDLIIASSSMRSPALELVEQVLSSNGGEEDMAHLLVSLHSPETNDDLPLKAEILHGLLSCFRESHRARCNFRKAGGFLYLMSLLVSMEGVIERTDECLKERMQLIQLIFTSFALSMRFEPANAKLFHQEICVPSLGDTLKLLGCFSRNIESLPKDNWKKVGDETDQFQTIFTSFSYSTTNIPESVPFPLVFSVFLYRLLFDLATDSFERSPALPSSFPRSSPRKQQSSELSADSSPTLSAPPSPNPAKKGPSGGLHFGPPLPEPIVIHPTVVLVMIRLLPAISAVPVQKTEMDTSTTSPVLTEEETHLSKHCQLFCAELIKSLVRSERNQQVMAQAGLTQEILDRCSMALSDENHFIHSPIHYAFERVATHYISAKDIRRFMRLGNPLNCERVSPPSVNMAAVCIPVPLSRVKSLVSMTTPRSHHHHGGGAGGNFEGSPLTATPSPPFVEFDMAAEGFACLFLPSLAPQGSMSGQADFTISSPNLLPAGMGSSGMSFSSWFFVEKFSDPRHDPHPIRILTIVKEANNTQRLCLSIVISARDKAVIVSTRDSQLPPQGVGEWEPDVSAGSCIRVWCPELLHESQWHHIFCIFSPSSGQPFSVFVNGRIVHAGKLDYPGRSKGASYSAFIGTPPLWRKISRLIWRQGVCHYFEDWTPSQGTVAALWKLGPEYPGSFQAVKTQIESSGSMVPEDKIIFGLNAFAVSQLTLQKIRKLYSKSDAKAIAKQLGLSSHENATPIWILHNSAAHLMGPGRSLGGVAIGYLGVRIFPPSPVSKAILSVGGVKILIGLVAMATTAESLYAALKALVCTIKGLGGQKNNVVERSDWQMIGFLLKRKKNFLSMRVLHLVFNLVTVEGRHYRADPAFTELLGDLEIWTAAGWNDKSPGARSGIFGSDSGPSSPIGKTDSPACELSVRTFGVSADLEKALYEHFLTMLTEDPKGALEVLREAEIVPKILRRLSQASCSGLSQPSMFLLLGYLLSQKGVRDGSDLVTFGHFVVGTLGLHTERESYLTETIELRNRSLQLLHSLLYTGKVLNVGFCEELVSRLGFDFILLFAAPNLHPSSVLWSIRILLLLITSSAGLKQKFREGNPVAFGFGRSGAAVAGGQGGILPLKKQDTKEWEEIPTGGVSLMMKGKGPSWTGGWGRISYLLAQRSQDIKTEGSEIFPNEIWLLLCAMVLSQPCRNVSLKGESLDNLTLDSIWLYVFALPSNKMTSSLYGKVTLCPDAILTLLTLIRCFLTTESPQSGGSVVSSPTGPHSDIGSCLVQFLCFLYSHTPEFQGIFTSTDVLSSLSATLIPIQVNQTTLSETETLDFEELKVFSDSEPMINIEKVEMAQEASELESETDSYKKPIVGRAGEIIPKLPPNTSSGDHLMNHPAKKIILDFIRMVLIDLMSGSGNASKSNSGTSMSTVIDNVLDAGGIEERGPLVSQLHTSLLGTLLDHIIAFDLDRMTPYLIAVAQFISRLVDKLWLETFLRDPSVVLDFILVLIGHCRVKRVPPTTTDIIYNSLNRVVLFILSRRSRRWDKVEALKKLRSVRSVIFGSGNHQQEFFGCLVHVLLQLVDSLPIVLEGHNKTQWHVAVEPIDIQKEDANLSKEISSTAEKVWEDLFISKKPLVEEVFKITFPSPKPPTLSSLRDMVGDMANKLWLVYVTSETTAGPKKSQTPAGMTQSWEIHQQLQSKLQKVTGGLTRLTSLRNLAGRSGITRKESEKEKIVKDLVTQWIDAKRHQLSSNKNVQCMKEVLESQEKCKIENQRHLHRYVRDTLLPQLEQELTRERSLWGSYMPSHLDKWMNDTTEGPSRMRKKLMRNDLFYIHYPYQAEPEQRSLISMNSSSSLTSSPKIRRINPPISRDSKEYHKRFKHQPSLISEICGTSISSLDEVDEGSPGLQPIGSSSSDTPLSPKPNQVQQAGEDPFQDETCEDPDNQSMLFRLIGSSNEKISQMFRVAQIQGLDTAEGLLLFGKDSFYLISGFTIVTWNKTREIKDMYYLPANMYEPILPPQCYGTGPTPARPRTKTHSCFRFSYEDIREVLKRRYLLQPIALEIFCSDGRNYLLAFPPKVRSVVYQKFTSVTKSLGDSGIDGKESVAGQRRTASVEQSSGLFSSLIGETSVTQRWVRGELSNFQYLMYLNTLAGRSYNDLMQYPVFPWILADYDSPILDFSDPLTFRDLGKPMGAQSNGRLVQFVKRFKEWDDPHGETPPYHYGTHYSSAMIVCSYLVRMEPFAQHFLRLQGGHFDLADRMFHSIKEAWTSASKHNMADVKELIPEFFYLPEFLGNSNHFDLGLKQNGVALGDVLLPPWAKNDPREFIRVHRLALESDYVSQHLNEWIDLVFGYKQQGPPAVESVNVFHHLFYEGNVDIYTIDDPLKKNATIGFINNFGQIPKQLFKKSHPAKRVNVGHSGIMKPLGQILDNASSNPLLALAATTGVTTPVPFGERLFFHHVDNLRPTLSPIKELKGPVGQILCLEKPNNVVAVEQNKYLLSPSKYISWGFADCSVRVCHTESERALLVWEASQQAEWTGHMGEILACTAPSEKVVVTGSTNSVVSVWDVGEKELRLKAHLYGHSEPITCLAASHPYNIIVSGSKDLTVIVWDLARLIFVRQLIPHTGAIEAIAVNELTGDIATCASSWLYIWSINGEPIGKIDTAGVGGGGGMSQGIFCVGFSYFNEWDSDNVLMTGSTDGIVKMWSVGYVQISESEAEDVEGVSVSDQDSSLDEGPEETDVLTAEVFDPDKDRDSLEEEKGDVKAVIRRQRALSSGTSPNSPETAAEKKAKRKSDIPKRDGRNPTIRGSKSETSLSFDGDESFEVVTDQEAAIARTEERKMSLGTALINAHTLREGNVWQKRILYRGKLTMHTAYERKDNAEPASITALSISKDHRNVYVGDARGRVYSWAMSEQGQAGGRADHWVKDEGSDSCAACSAKFSITERKHHCRNCGQVFCSKCSRFESEIFRLRILRPVRVCQPCFVQLKGRMSSTGSEL